MEEPTYQMINDLLEQESSERDPDEATSSFVGAKRLALDSAFGHDSVEAIFAELTDISNGHKEEDIRQWAASTLEMLNLRSPTSLKVALAAIRRGKEMSLLDALQMEMNIATAFCVSQLVGASCLYRMNADSDLQSGVSPDFQTGVTAVLVQKVKTRPEWSPAHLHEVDDGEVLDTFFNKFTPEKGTAPLLSPPSYLPSPTELSDPMRYALPTEAEIRSMVDGSHRNSGATEITLEELLSNFERMRGNKAGMREKILEVVQRKCTSEQDKHMDKKWLKWNH